MASSVKYDNSSHVFQSEILNGIYNPYTDTIVYDGGLVDEEKGDKERIIIYDGGDLSDLYSIDEGEDE